MAQAAGDWRWGVRTTPFLAYIALVVLVLFLTDPPRGNLILRAYHFARTNYSFLYPVSKMSHEMCLNNIIGHNAQLDGEKLAGRDSWKEDIKYLFKNKSFMFSSAGFTFLTFFCGGLSWWGPHYIEDAIKFRNETMSRDEIESDPDIDR